ncbi:hypothetical protein RHGRI_026812 [Rhododendron griersonianum]|uniref:THO complex subunitTHOC2 N-terminal domain-containing protein n=1 Tax=Rhododendron griersonianum TaxID=479676 RepID=A0AAV6IYG1_9ERIC|nr:hypothetical protein RHGRI_026812 [Rhododendron griersonianum]
MGVGVGVGAVEKPHLFEKVGEVAWGGRHGGSYLLSISVQLEYDILEYVVIERVAQVGREKLKDDGFNLSDWLQSLNSFWGHLCALFLFGLDTVAKLKIECPSWIVYVVVEVVFLPAAPTIL